MGAEEANCMLSLTASGLLHRFPTLKILMTHGGGSFPALKGRIEQGIRCRRQWVWPGELCSVFFNLYFWLSNNYNCILSILHELCSLKLFFFVFFYKHLAPFCKKKKKKTLFLYSTCRQFLVIIMKKWV